MATVTIHSDFEAQEKKICHCFHFSPSICHEIKRHLLLGRKAMTDLDSVLKSRDVTLPREVCVVKAVFSSSHV